MKEHYVSYEQAKRLNKLGFDAADKYYVTENFCEGNNPYFFNTYSVGDLVDECVVYYVNEDNEDDYRGIPAPRLDQAAAWLRDEKGIHVSVNPYKSYDVDADGELYNEYPLWSFELMEVSSAEFMNNAAGKHDTYEAALSAGITQALKILETNH